MLHKNIKLFSLILAYSITLAHAFIPHHHHCEILESVNFYDSATQLHIDSEEESHNHASHFVHAPEFGNFFITSKHQPIKIARFQMSYLPSTHLELKYNAYEFLADVYWHPKIPAFTPKFLSSPNSLRGSPASFSII